MRPFVFVAGLPGSGNRAIQRALAECGLDTWIVHGTTPVDDLAIEDGTIPKHASRRRSVRRVLEEVGRRGRDQVRIVVPVRSSLYRAGTYARPFYSWCRTRYEDRALVGAVIGCAEQTGVQVRMVSYEAFVEHPRDELEALLSDLGVDVEPLPELDWVEDGNAKWRRDDG